MLDQILALAARLPTGLNDPRALDKYHKERLELNEALAAADTLGAILEAGDCAYYAIKAKHNSLIEAAECDRLIAEAAQLVGLSVEQVLAVSDAKFQLRARPGNPKNDTEERNAVVRRLYPIL